MICIYHSRDLDGYSSAAIIKLKYPEAKLIGFDYGQTLPMHQIPAGEEVIMVDVSLPMAEMKHLAVHAGKLTWIDHHKSAIDDFHAYFCKETPRKEVELSYGGGGLVIAYPLTYLGIRHSVHAQLQIGIAACEIAWQWCFGDTEMPMAIKLLGEYDTWRNSDNDRWENGILPFQFGLRQICNSPETFPQELFLLYPKVVDDIIKQGITILQYQAQVNAAQCKGAFEYEFEGYKAICLNAGGINSEAFKTVYDESKHDIMMPFKYDGKTGNWVISLYSTKPEIDCSAIAKTRGGGGHKGAAGFQVKDINTVFTNLNN